MRLDSVGRFHAKVVRQTVASVSLPQFEEVEAARQSRKLRNRIAGTVVVVATVVLVFSTLALIGGVDPVTLSPGDGGPSTAIVDDAGAVGQVTTTITAPAQLLQEGLDLQREILADDIVTREELEQAVAAMAVCMEARGLKGVHWSVDPEEEGLGWSGGYSVTDSVSGAEAVSNLCYYSYVHRLGP